MAYSPFEFCWTTVFTEGMKGSLLLLSASKFNNRLALRRAILRRKVVNLLSNLLLPSLRRVWPLRGHVRQRIPTLVTGVYRPGWAPCVRPTEGRKSIVCCIASSVTGRLTNREYTMKEKPSKRYREPNGRTNHRKRPSHSSYRRAVVK